LSWPWSQAAQVVDGWQSWVPPTPDTLWSNLHLIASPHGGLPTVQVGGTYLGTVSAVQGLLSALYGAVGSPPARAAGWGRSQSTHSAARSTRSTRRPPLSCTGTPCSSRSTRRAGAGARQTARWRASGHGCGNSTPRCTPTPAGTPTRTIWTRILPT